MFDLLRSWIKPIIYITLTVFLGLIVLEWGMEIGGTGRYAGDPQGAIGSVNGEEVTREQFNGVYSNLYSNRQAQSEADLSPAEEQKLREQAWDQIVSDFVLRQEFTKYGITVTDQDIFNYVRYNPPQVLRDAPQFQTDAKFDYQKYMQAMADPNNAPLWAQVEQMVLPSVQIAKLQELITGAARITLDEVRDAYLRTTEMADFAVVSVPSSAFVSTVGEVTPEETQRYYEENSFKFKTEERRVLQLVLIGKDVTEEDWTAVRARLQTLSDSLTAGADFASLAKSHSADGSASVGGDLGFMPISSLDTQFIAGAMALEIGQVSGPVRSAFGWHIIKLNGYKDGNGKVTKDKSKAVEIHTSHIILQVQASEATFAAARRKAQEFRASAEADGFENAATKFGLKLETTSPFQKGGSIDLIGPDPAGSAFAFGAKIGEISGALENTSNCFVARLEEVKPAGIVALEEIRPTILNLARNEKAKNAALDSARAIYKEVTAGGGDMESLAAKHQATFQRTGLIDRASMLPSTVGQDPKAFGAMFSLKDIGQISEPMMHDRGAAFFKLMDRQAPGVEQFQAAKDSVSTQLLQGKQNNYWQRWYTARIMAAKAENKLDSEIAAAEQAQDSTSY